jgi:hypothetical protein
MGHIKKPVEFTDQINAFIRDKNWPSLLNSLL